MIALRKLTNADLDVLSEKTPISRAELKSMIGASDAGSFQGRHFEVYGMTEGNTLVGFVSLYERSASVLSIGPEVFEEYRRRGYASEAMSAALEIARANGYRIVLQQVRTDNTASVRLHEKLGFETDGAVYKNRKQNDIFLYWKPI